MGFTHADTVIARNAGSGDLSVTLSLAVGAGDLLVAQLESPTAPSVSDTAGNTWSVLGPFASFGYVAYVLSSAAAAGGITITGHVVSGTGPRQIAADRFTHTGIASFGGSAGSSPGTLGLNFSSAYNLGDLGVVPAGTLVWGGFSCDDATGNQAYTAGFQSGSAGTADVIASQVTGANGTGFSAYVLSASNSDAAMTWFGTGAGAAGQAASMYFTATNPPPVLTRQQQQPGRSMLRKRLMYADV